MRHIPSLRSRSLSVVLAAAATFGFSVAPALRATGAPTPTSWTVATAPSPTGSWDRVVYAGGQWVALGHGSRIATSPDGSTWTEHAVPAGSWQSVAYGDGRYVALNASGASPHEMTSSDGVSWTSVAGPGGFWNDVTFGGHQFVAVGSLGQIYRSDDGMNWTKEFLRPRDNFTSVAYGNGRFVAVDSVHGDTTVSIDGGVLWAFYLTPIAGASWGSVAFGNGNFVALDSSTAGFVARTVLGYVWNIHNYAPAQIIRGATFGCGTFLGVGEDNGAGNNIQSSVTGAVWTSQPVPTDAGSSWSSVAYGNHRFVAVDTAGNVAWSSSGSYCGPTIPLPPPGVTGNVHNAEVWTYMSPATGSGGARVDGYRVTITDGTTTTYCHAPVYYEPNCIIWGLKNRKIYTVTAQSHNRYGYSVPTDLESVVAVASWNLDAWTPPVLDRSVPVVLQLTGVTANSLGIYPYTPVTVHFGARILTCHPDSYGECLLTVANLDAGPVAMYATYYGYGVSYRSPTRTATVATVNLSSSNVAVNQSIGVTVHNGIDNSTARLIINGVNVSAHLDASGNGTLNIPAPATPGSYLLSILDAGVALETPTVLVHS